MSLRTGDQYVASIEALDLAANVLGQGRVPAAGHPLVRPSLRAVAVTYDCAHDPDTQALFRAYSPLVHDEVNRFTHLHQGTDDLVSKVLMQRHCGNVTGCCFQRCVGMDAANAIYSVTYECDAAHGSEYHRRFCDYWGWVQREDLVVDGAMTDPKGDRSKRPSEQSDPDLYLRVVDRRPDGIVVRGAKFHQTGLLNSHEILVMPTAALRPGEEDWAVCFAMPANAPGVRYLLGRQASDTRKLEEGLPDVGNPLFGGQEVLAILDDVFVPRERVFLDGEVEHSGALVERFAAYHRQSYGGCKVGVGDVLIGASALIAAMNGVERASHVRDKLVEMIHLNETMFACGIACSVRGQATAAGNYLVDLLLANVCKLNVTRFPYEMARLATDIAGGLLGTVPSARELDDPELGPYVLKYLAAAPGWQPADRVKVLRLIENLVAGAGAVAYLVESMHGAGSPMAQRIVIGRQAGLEGKVALARRLLGLAPD
ncbi:MAG TPA: 4-hydroxyphenylacetate 3-hydroxylase N-terminal domain-containing protein [Anaerolineae bacterium]|nr:4-hydroxyphenylacetate 3-hydroxylase N-terminal domain-containing protein [Anaerolineae bacterium]